VSVTGIVAALAVEARTLRSRRPARLGGASAAPAIDSLDDGSLLVISGMGSEAAAAAALALLAAGARNLLSFGLAGGLDPALAAGAILLPQAVTDDAGTVHMTFSPWRERLAARLGSRVVVGGTLLSVARPLTTPESKSEARIRTAACAVDMESFAVAAVAARHAVNFLVARAVVDTASDTVPGSVMLATGPHGEIDVPRLLLGLMRAPSQLGGMLQLARRSRAALDSLRYLARRGVAA